MSETSNRWWHPRTLVLTLTVSFIATLIWQSWSDPQKYFELGKQGLAENDRSKIERAVHGLKDNPNFIAQYTLFEASLSLRDNKPAEALRLALACQDHPDVAVETRVIAGEAAFQLGGAGNAKLYWEEALSLDPECVAAHQWLGVLYFDLGAMDNAMLHLQAVSQLSPNDPRPDRLMGLINRDYERPEIAISHYRETLRRAPKQPDYEDVWLELAECELKQREYDSAKNSLSQCSDSPRKKRLLAQCLLNLGSLEEARQLAEQAIATEPNNLDVLRLNAEIALVDGQVQRAADLLLKGVEINPFHHGTRTQLAQVLGRLGQEEQSMIHSARAAELQVLWQRFSDLQIDAINQMTNADIRYEIGTLASQLGMPELARTWFKAALAINPGMKQASQALAQFPESQKP